jgi:hypothetical protein
MELYLVSLATHFRITLAFEIRTRLLWLLLLVALVDLVTVQEV